MRYPVVEEKTQEGSIQTKKLILISIRLIRQPGACSKLSYSSDSVCQLIR